MSADPMEQGRLAPNVVHFCRILRRAGLPIGPGKVLDALLAVQTVGVARKEDFYYALAAVLVNRREQQTVFDQAFQLFWRHPGAMQQRLHEILHQSGVRAKPGADKPVVAARVAQAMLPAAASPRAAPEVEHVLDASLTLSPREILRHKDFAAMSAEEMAQASAMLAEMRVLMPQIRSRRMRLHSAGARVDMRATLRAMVRAPAGLITLRYGAARMRPAVLVILCDISGSMESYSRLLLHFFHALANREPRVHTFLFGTRLSNISRALRDRDVDAALERVAREVKDWSGGTRIASCLNSFNRYWARRLLGQGATVLLISDGLEGDEAAQLADEMARLRRSCRRLLWLNPLLRYSRFEPKAAGIRAMLPHVDAFMPVHNLASVTQLVGELRKGLGSAGDTVRRANLGRV